MGSDGTPVPARDTLRDELFAAIRTFQVTAAISFQQAGVVAGMDRAKAEAMRLGLEMTAYARDGQAVGEKEVVARLVGGPAQVTAAEEVLLGVLAKTSGIATASRRMAERAGDRIRVVSGAWKKMPLAIKDQVREAIAAGGAAVRILDEPFLYLDKNHVRIFGGVAETLAGVQGVASERVRVVQLRGQIRPIRAEAEEAVGGGAGVLMVDTGRVEDLQAVLAYLTSTGRRASVKVAFAGGVTLADLPTLVDQGLDIVDVGAAIVDAPLLEVRLDVEAVRGR